MALHIGNVIHEVIKKSSIEIKEIATLLGRSEQAIYAIYKRESINTHLLLDLCRILNYNFFAHFDTVEPINEMRNDEIEVLKKAVAELEDKTSIQQEHINTLKIVIEDQKLAYKNKST